MNRYTTLRTSSVSGFAYTPPGRLYGAVRVLLIVEQARPDVLANVLRGFWRFTPVTRVLITETPVLAPTMLNDNMKAVDLSVLPMRPYDSRLLALRQRAIAPTLLADVDACVVLATCSPEAATVPPALAMVHGQAENRASLTIPEAFFCLGHLFAGAVVDAGDKLIWGDDLLEVDTMACGLHNQAVPADVTEIRQHLATLAKPEDE